jgi:hypothetical protein
VLYVIGNTEELENGGKGAGMLYIGFTRHITPGSQNSSYRRA